MHLARHLQRAQAQDAQVHHFFPRTWILPEQASALKAYTQAHPSAYYIAKPAGESQGRGIYLTKEVAHLEGQHMLVQEYVANPALIEGLKYDLRLYVLLRSVDPLRIYIYKDGLVRLATKPYRPPAKDNLHDLHMHLTNYAINKLSPEFIYNERVEQDNVGHKRSFSSLLRLL